MINYAEADLSGYPTPRFKLIIDSHNTGGNEFYDLMDDPGETQNLYADPRPEVQAAIAELFERNTATIRRRPFICNRQDNTLMTLPPVSNRNLREGIFTLNLGQHQGCEATQRWK